MGGPLAYSPSAPSERELLPDEQVQQVLNRLAFGARPGDAAKVRAMGIDNWIQLQLHPESIPDDTTARLIARYRSLTVPTGEMMRTFQVVQQARQQQQRQLAKTGDSAAARRNALFAGDPQMMQAVQLTQRTVPELQAATLSRAVTSERQLDEVMVNFWENHFSVFANKGQQERLFLTAYDRDVIRPHALGKFRDLLGAVAHSPAMLFYLDNWQSQADSVHPTLARNGAQAQGDRGRGFPPPGFRPPGAGPRRGLNENYARELMELHTLGVDGGYTQHDVIEVARALTGWSIAMGQGGGFIFRPEAHDAGTKTVLGHRLAAGRGQEDGEEVLDIVAHSPSTATFITTKLARHFVSDEPPKALVNRCATVFTQSDGDIRQTVGCIVTSAEFFSHAAYRSKVKTPFEVVASAFRAMQAEPDSTPRSAQVVAQLGQPIFGHLTPDGWPDRGDAWMNTGAILGRINFGLQVASGRVPGVTMGHVAELDQLRSAPTAEQADGVVKLFFGGQVSSDTRQVLLSGENPLLSTLTPDTTAAVGTMNGRGGSPPFAQPLGGGRGRGMAPVSNQPIALRGLAQMVGLALGRNFSDANSYDPERSEGGIPSLQSGRHKEIDHESQSIRQIGRTVLRYPRSRAELSPPQCVRVRAGEGRGHVWKRSWESAHLPFPARRGRRLEHDRSARRPRVLPDAAGDRGAAAGDRECPGGHRSRRLLRAPSVARAAQGALGPWNGRPCPRRRKSEQHAVAL
jgi:uncharacterized protein (DUF1800 family)